MAVLAKPAAPIAVQGKRVLAQVVPKVWSRILPDRDGFGRPRAKAMHPFYWVKPYRPAPRTDKARAWLIER